jgi:Uma2 family endonuclease
MSVAYSPQKIETLEDLAKEPGKAELIGGRIVRFLASGCLPGIVTGRIFLSLARYAEETGRGVAFGDDVGFAIRPPLSSGRQSFSPDAAYFTGPLPANLMRFPEGAPILAIEVRSENDYGPAAERAMAEKRSDYFEAGTKVVWDVDPVAGVVNSYAADSPQTPTSFARGQEADAESAAPGWRVSLDWLFK